MVKMPRNVKRYCPSCKSHQLHAVERVKKRKASEHKMGQRRFRRVTAGYRGFPRPKFEGREKPTKRVPLRLRCKECGKAYQVPGFRIKKFELSE